VLSVCSVCSANPLLRPGYSGQDHEHLVGAAEELVGAPHKLGAELVATQARYVGRKRADVIFVVVLGGALVGGLYVLTRYMERL
jgi:hypothetical protein